MKTLNFFKLLLSIVFISLFHTNNAQVALCKQNVIKSTLPWDCTATIKVAEIDMGSYDFDSLSLNQSIFLSPGTYNVELSAYKNGIAATCTTMVEIVDKTPPVVLIQNQITIKLNESGETTLNTADFDNGSYDNCGVITNITLTPATVNSNMISPIVVTMRVYDDAGNWNEALVSVRLSNSICDICDFLSWDTPLNSCSEGHVDNDAIEWPASFTTISKNFTPIDFKYDNTVDIRNAYPQMKEACLLKYNISYNDVLLSQNTDSIVVQRKWNLLNIETNENYSYVQILTILDPYTTEHTFCTRSMTGRPINNVNLFPDMDIDDGPCKTFEINVDTQVTPTKTNTNLFDGVDIADLILIYEHILGIKAMNNIQMQAADINNDGKITAYDSFKISRLIHGDSSEVINYAQWSFYLDNYNIDYYNFYNIAPKIPFSTWLTTSDSLNNNYHLIGIKLGDINDSYDDDANKITNVTLDDTILTKGEKSTVKIKATQDLYVDGFQFRIIKNDKIKIDKIKSVFNNGVEMVETNNHTSVISFGNSISGPNFIENNETFIEIEYTALENTVLSQALIFSDNGNNKIVLDSTLETSNLVFNFGAVISETNDVVNEHITLQPNPASNEISFNGISTQAELEIFTIQGLKIKSATVTNQSIIDISLLAPSMYIAKLQPENSKAQIIRFVKF